MLRIFLLILFFVLRTAGFSQKKTDTLSLFYNINEFESARNYERLDSSLIKHQLTHFDVAIHGYADFLGSNDYNRALSIKRAVLIKKHILNQKENNKLNVYICEGKGESFSVDNSSPDGEPAQRRVDVLFEPIVTLQVADSKLEDPKFKEQKSVPENIKNDISQLKTGESLALEGLSFEPGRHFIVKESSPVLQKLLLTLKNNPNLKIQIRGHVCCTLNGMDGLDLDTREMKLSENRAKAIYDYLISKGIDKSRLSYVGLGRTEPKFEIESSPEEEQANRRVEIKIIEK